MSSEAAIVTALQAALATAGPAVSSRVHEGQLPDDSRYPAIRLVVVSSTMQPRLKTDAGELLLQVDVYDQRRRDIGDAWSIAALVRADLHRKRLSVDGVGGVAILQVDRGRLYREDDCNRILSQFRVFINGG